MAAARPPKRPAWTRFLAVDVVIERLSFGAEGPAVRAALHGLAPRAYERPIRLGSVWSRLSPETQRAIEAAWQREKQGAPLRQEAR